MQDQSPILSLPLIQPSQAQKHVTHNEALRILDILVQLAVIDRDRTSPPENPAPGDRHIVAAGAIGAWSGADMRIAVREEGGWGFLDPLPGWRAEVLSEAREIVFDGTVWVSPVPELNDLPGLGLNISSDATNRLAVAAPATLLSHEGAGHRLKINKAAPAETASLLFQTGFSGRAEIGTAGHDDWSVKVSPDGAGWIEALRVEAATGHVTGQAVQSSPTDSTAGRLMAVGAFGLGAQPPDAAGSLNEAPSGFSRVTTSDTDKPGPSDAAGILWTQEWDGTDALTQLFIAHSPSAIAGHVFARTKIGGVWGSWNTGFSQKSVLGTVSEAGGLPTGALIERGSNGNGRYVRFADGTQICTHAMPASDAATTNWTYPAFFTAPPTVSAAPVNASFRTCTVLNVTGVSVDFDSWNVAGQRRANTVLLSAAGRWF